jgi:murein DD-endopeptidase MepM/ murein hydrolase activator NlpD
MIRAALALAAVLPALAAAGPPPGLDAAEAALRAEGRRVAALVVAGDAAALHARFTPEFAAQVPLAEAERVLAELRSGGPVGARVGESVLPASRDRRVYIADHRQGGRTLGITVQLDRAGAIAGLGVQPRDALPPDPHAGYRLRSKLRLPFRGTWWVFWGGSTERQNYHVRAPDQRHAYDLVVWRAGATHRGAGARNADYWAWGRPVLAPADARVVAAVDGIRDNRPQVQVENRRAPAGNHVVLDLGHGEFALLAHLRRGSVRVRRGEHVRAGAALGLAGNSGNSSEPHLHFHVQDRARLFGAARGLPVTFRGYRADGRRVARGTPVQGELVAPG